MKTPNVEVKIDQYSLWIFINDVLHVEIPLKAYRGMSSWCDGPHGHTIEFMLAGSEPLVVEYGSRDMWREILAKLAAIL